MTNIFNIYGQDYPVLTEINGVKVIIWTLEQDKFNSVLIERYFECDSLQASTDFEIKTMRKIKREDEIQYNNILEAYNNSLSIIELSKENLNLCDEQRANDKKLIKKLRRQNLFLKVGGAAIAVLILIALL